MKAPFTFAVISYNCESYIIDCLESIKYQVLEYGKGRDVYLVIADDQSSDSSQLLINKWVNLNCSLFKDVTVHISEANKGVSSNYANALKRIKTDLMKTIDADDFFSSYDVMSEIESLQDTEMGIFLPLRFYNKTECMFYEEKEVCEFLYYLNYFKHSNVSDCKLISTIKPFITPEACTRRKYYTSECIAFFSEYKQFEDDPSIYYIFKNNKNIKLKYVSKPLVCYRIHDNSLTHGISIHQIKFINDLHSYVKFCFKKEKNIFVKMILFWKMKDTFLQKHFFSIGFSKYQKIVKKRKENAVRLVKKEDCIFDEYIKNIDIFTKNENIHYSFIKKNVQNFFKVID